MTFFTLDSKTRHQLPCLRGNKMALTPEEAEEYERKKKAKIAKKAHVRDLTGMQKATKSTGELHRGERWKTQQPFKDAVQTLKDYKSGLFLLDFVDKIKCSEPKGISEHEGWDKCVVHTRNHTKEFYDINTILTDEYKVKNIKSQEGKFEINFKEPTAVELYTWHGSLIDLNPNEIKKVVMQKGISPKYRKQIAYRMRFTNLAKKGEISERL